jgi:hypothetical protein
MLPGFRLCDASPQERKKLNRLLFDTIVAQFLNRRAIRIGIRQTMCHGIAEV